ncbi:myo-inositol 2-dehydrogenase protein [Rutstroemia sp. NJR-2017a WRK4]|nr:myo-inositol 2-dehydrogenase protein [Rutstroemia sp. NJR-2017a WRK4]
MAPILRVGIIGLGEIAQVSHISVLNHLSTHFQITYLCDASPSALSHCALKITTPNLQTTSSPSELCSSPTVDVVLITSAHGFHPSHAILTLQNDKYALVEKPVALCYRDLEAMRDAERTSKGKIFVGYQRRYAQAFLDAVQEVGGMGKIQYARVRDIIGPNSTFVAQSATFPRKFDDFRKEDEEEMVRVQEEQVQQALGNEFGVEVTSSSKNFLVLLGGLGTHDLSAMREILGMPQKVLGSSLGMPFWTVLFQFDGFAVTYESGLNNVPVFDAHIEVYSEEKIVRINYDSPYVKGLPVTMTIRERVGTGYQERTVRKTYEDPYTLEFLNFYDCVVNGKTPKTSVNDARFDLDIFKMIMQSAKVSE